MPAFNPATARPRRHTDDVRLRMTKRSNPLGEMNVTPFIDVLLVLLIMIIMAVPIKEHVTQIDLPVSPCIDCSIGEVNTVAIGADDQLLWNGTPLTSEQLRRQVSKANALLPEAQLRFEPHAMASYDRAARTIALIKESGATRFAFVGNEQHKDFDR